MSGKNQMLALLRPSFTSADTDWLRDAGDFSNAPDKVIGFFLLLYDVRYEGRLIFPIRLNQTCFTVAVCMCFKLNLPVVNE